MCIDELVRRRDVPRASEETPARLAPFERTLLPLSLWVVAAVVAGSTGCGSREPMPTESDPNPGMPTNTGTGNGEGPAGDTAGLGYTGPADTGGTGAASTGNPTVGSTTGATLNTTGATSTTTDATSTDATSSTTDGTSDTGTSSTGEYTCVPDAWEPNDAMDAPTILPLDSSPTLDASLCAGESDWYRFEVDDLMYGIHQLRIHGIVDGSSWCGEPCGDPFLPDAPENTMGVEIYDAETLALITSQVAMDGEAEIHAQGAAYSQDLLIHVYGPTPAANYDYRLWIEMFDYTGEDECEC